MDNIIGELAKVGKNYYGYSFSFKKEANLFIAKSDNMSSAINNKKNDAEKVSVIKWFDDLWAYIEIKFTPKVGIKTVIPNIFFSLSVFQGSITDPIKTQLFRAEWDNFPEQEKPHSQPHWHVFPHKYSANIHKSFEDFLDLGKNDNDFNSFLGDKTNVDSEIIKINRVHFAMNGQWSDNKNDIHTLSDKRDLINWFKGLLNHLKRQLEYVKEK